MKVMCFVTSDRQGLGAQISDDVYDLFLEQLDTIGIQEKICLVIHSTGGSVASAWSLISLMQMYADELTVVIPSRAASAATLMALGSKQIMMTKQDRLGPIDPSINGPLNPVAGGNPVPVSVEAVNGFMGLSREYASAHEDNLAKVLMHLAEKVHPLVLGEVFRSRSYIRMIGRDLLSGHMDDELKVTKILDFLCSESGSHLHTINRRYAKDVLGLNVVKPSISQYDIIKKLYDDFKSELELDRPFHVQAYMDGANDKGFAHKMALLESANRGYMYVQEGDYSCPDNVRDKLGSSKIKSYQVFTQFSGWKEN